MAHHSPLLVQVTLARRPHAACRRVHLLLPARAVPFLHILIRPGARGGHTLAVEDDWHVGLYLGLAHGLGQPSAVLRPCGHGHRDPVLYRVLLQPGPGHARPDEGHMGVPHKKALDPLDSSYEHGRIPPGVGLFPVLLIVGRVILRCDRFPPVDIVGFRDRGCDWQCMETFQSSA